MSETYQIQRNVDGEQKRMCVYSKRDLEYMTSKGWSLYEKPPEDLPFVPPSPRVEASEKPVKRRGRPAKGSH